MSGNHGSTEPYLCSYGRHMSGNDGSTEPLAVDDGDDAFSMLCTDSVDSVDSALDAFWTSEQETLLSY